MDNKTLVHQTGQARGKLMRLEQDLGRAKGNLDSATRNRIVGGVVLLIGLLALIGFFVMRSQFVAVIAAAGLLIGGWVFIRALMKIGGTRRSIDTMTDKVANAQAKLDELKAQPSSAE
jgi:Flp pilus assembly protein TadB